MKYMKELKPYNNFWGNCITNMLLSILLERDLSYEPIIYMNDYQYVILPTGLYVDYSKEYYDYFRDIFVFNRCKFKDKNNFLAEFKDILVNNAYVTLNIDLFYWDENGVFYNKVHNPHFSFIVGFDDENNQFYAFEDNVNLDYGVKNIPTSNLIQAFQSDYKDNREDYRIITFKNPCLKPYILSISQVFHNAERLVLHLEELIKIKNILNRDILLSDISNIFRLGNECGKVPNRLKGNVLLVNNISDKGMLDEACINGVVERIEQISDQWRVIKNLLFMYYYGKRAIDLDKAESLIIEAFIKERDFWLNFIKLKH